MRLSGVAGAVSLVLTEVGAVALVAVVKVVVVHVVDVLLQPVLVEVHLVVGLVVAVVVAGGGVAVVAVVRAGGRRGRQGDDGHGVGVFSGRSWFKEGLFSSCGGSSCSCSCRCSCSC